MENQTTYTCPNCGATITNSRNCEYCGSLLVRFAAQNIPLNTDKYGKEGFSFPGLEAELRKNLALQRQFPQRSVVTVITTDENDENNVDLEVSNRGTYAAEGASSDKPGIELSLHFFEDDESAIFRLNNFKRLDIFSLFNCHVERYIDGPEEFVYYIDFGEDYLSASKLITTIVSEVFFKDPSMTTLIFDTWTDEPSESSMSVSMNPPSKKTIIARIALVVGILFLLGAIAVIIAIQMEM